MISRITQNRVKIGEGKKEIQIRTLSRHRLELRFVKRRKPWLGRAEFGEEFPFGVAAMVGIDPRWRAEAALALGYFISRLQREEEPSLTVGLLPRDSA